MSTETIEAAPPTHRLPKGMGYAFAFQVFNSISYIIVLSTPMVLWFKQWGASATELGVVAALNPLLNFLQVVGARRLHHVGYRKFVLRGWTARSFSIIGMVVAAALPVSVPMAVRLAVMWISLAAFTGIRGWYTAGFLPWMTHLTPEKLRGRYLSGDQISTAFATVATMIATAIFLGTVHSRYNFGWVFGASFVAAVISLSFLARIPDVPVPPEEKSGGRVPWKEMFLYPPFRKLVLFNIVNNIAFAASSVFWVPLVRDQYGASNSTMLVIMALYNGVLMISLILFGRVVDRVGSRPLLGVSLAAFTVHFFSWASLAARVLPFNWTTLVLIQMTSGLAAALYNLANLRLLMGSVPKMGRSHFFAMLLVINGLLLGTLPVLWGAGLDWLVDWHSNWGSWEWNRFTVMYVMLAGIMVVGQFFRRRIPEPKAMTTEAFLQELLVNTTSRALSRLGLRRPMG